MGFQVIRAPHEIPTGFSPLDRPVLFLGGTVEGPKWREKMITALAKADLDCTILDPYRADWDSSWEESVKDRRFTEQVEWETEARERADFVVMYFAPEAQSPVSMLELGLTAAGTAGEVLLCCPEGYFKKGHVDMVRIRYSIKATEDLECLIASTIDVVMYHGGDRMLRSRPDLFSST